MEPAPSPVDNCSTCIHWDPYNDWEGQCLCKEALSWGSLTDSTFTCDKHKVDPDV